jgi:hypothetical protein
MHTFVARSIWINKLVLVYRLQLANPLCFFLLLSDTFMQYVVVLRLRVVYVSTRWFLNHRHPTEY